MTIKVIEVVEYNEHGLQPLHGVQGQVGGHLEPVQPHGRSQKTSFR